MPGQLWKKDDKLSDGFLIEEVGDELHFKCKAKDESGEACQRSWAVDPNADGTIDVGIRNALLSHVKAHSGGFRKMRRLS